jgi:hypothetical protein
MEWIFRVLQPGNSNIDIQAKYGICIASCREALERVTSIVPKSTVDFDTIDTDVDVGSPPNPRQTGSPPVAAFDENTPLLLDDSSQKASSLGGYDYASRAETNVSSFLDQNNAQLEFRDSTLPRSSY